MDFTALADSLQNSLGTHLPNILGAIGILIIGWVIAVLVRAGVLAFGLGGREAAGKQMEYWLSRLRK